MKNFRKINLRLSGTRKWTAIGMEFFSTAGNFQSNRVGEWELFFPYSGELGLLLSARFGTTKSTAMFRFNLYWNAVEHHGGQFSFVKHVKKYYIINIRFSNHSKTYHHKHSDVIKEKKKFHAKINLRRANFIENRLNNLGYKHFYPKVTKAAI